MSLSYLDDLVGALGYTLGSRGSELEYLDVLTRGRITYLRDN